MEKFVSLATFSGETINVKCRIVPTFSSDSTIFVFQFDVEESDFFSAEKFHIVSNDLRKIVTNKELLSLLSTIETEFPLSLIEKKRLKNKLDKEQISLWIADSSGKITFANNNLKEFISFNSPEGFSENEIFLSSVSGTIKLLTEQATKYKAIIVKDDVRFIDSEMLSNFDIIKIPIVSSKDKVVATIGIIQPAKVLSLSDKHERLIFSSFENMELPVLVFDSSGKITALSKGFADVFGVVANELTGSSLSDFFGNKLSMLISDFLFSKKEDKAEFTLNDFYSGSDFNNLSLHIKKIFNSKNILSGGFITLTNLYNENFEKIMEEKFYEILLKSSPHPIFIYDSENLIFLDVNDAALALYGYDRKSFLKLDLTDLYSPENIQTLIETNRNEEESGWGNPVKNKKKDGSIVVVRMSKTNINYNEKEAVLTYLEDISTKVEIEKEVKEFRSFTRMTNEPFVETDAEGFIVKVNPAFLNLFAYSEKEIVGDSFISLITDKDRGEINKTVFIKKRTSEFEKEISFKNKKGKIFSAQVYFLPILDYFNEVISFSIFIKLEATKLIGDSDSIVSPQDSSNSKSVSSNIDASFLGHLFHELLTPINVIIGFSQELAESIPNPTAEQLESAEIIKENQKALKNLMDAATEYVALEENSVQIVPVAFSIVDVMDEIEERVKKVAQSYGVSLKYGKISSSIKLINDKDRVISLISMFWEFAVRGTKEGQVYIGAMHENGFVKIIIRDGKKSISQGLIIALNEFLSEDENIIRRNYGVSRFAVRLFRKLSHLLQVNFFELETAGEVTGFVLQFPVAIDLGKTPVTEVESKKSNDFSVENKHVEVSHTESNLKSDKREEEKIKQNITETIVNKVPEVNYQTDGTKSLVLSELSCLLLEDQIDSQILFKQQMKELKEISVATKFEDALPLLKQKRFDFIVMDINLQGEYNGLDALHEIRNIPEYKDVPVIAVTAYVMPGDHENYVRAGFDDFISKPVMRSKMLASLKRIIK